MQIDAILKALILYGNELAGAFVRSPLGVQKRGDVHEAFVILLPSKILGFLIFISGNGGFLPQ